MVSRSGWTLGRLARLGTMTLVATAYAGLTPGLAGRMSGSLLTLALCAAAVVLAFVVERPGKRGEWGSLDAGRLTAAGAGALALFLAPYLVLTHRFTDAPSGTEFLFLTTSGWGMIAALAAAAVIWRSRSPRAALPIAAGGFAALVGCASILANWERPSSFSPFLHFVTEETWMLAAGVVFVAGALLMTVATRSGVSFPYLTAAAAALALAALAWLLSGDGLSTLPLAGMAPNAATWALVGALLWLMWTREAVASGLVAPAAVLFTPPLLLPALSALEGVVGVAGPSPLVWGGIAGGSLVVVAGLARMVWRRGQTDGGSRIPAPAGRWSRAVAGYAAIVVIVAIIALALPAMQASVTGHREGGELDISWTMRGYESLAVWSVVALAGLLAAAAADDAAPAALGALLSAPAYWLLARTPTHVWTSALSADIQQDYGTEYANITFAALPSWPARVAVVGAAVGLVAVVARRAVSWRKGAGAPMTSVEEPL